jgi:hypothetical protein
MNQAQIQELVERITSSNQKSPSMEDVDSLVNQVDKKNNAEAVASSLLTQLQS